MKNIQAGFLTLPTLTRLPILSLSKDSGFFVKALTPKIWGRDYSGGSVPEFPTYAGSRGSHHLDITFPLCFLYQIKKSAVKFFNLEFNLEIHAHHQV
jgi:hypothetical protein